MLPSAMLLLHSHVRGLLLLPLLLLPPLMILLPQQTTAVALLLLLLLLLLKQTRCGSIRRGVRMRLLGL